MGGVGLMVVDGGWGCRMVFTPKQKTVSFPPWRGLVDKNRRKMYTENFPRFCLCADEKVGYFHDKITSCDIYGLICRVKTRQLSSFSRLLFERVMSFLSHYQTSVPGKEDYSRHETGRIQPRTSLVSWIGHHTGKKSEISFNAQPRRLSWWDWISQHQDLRPSMPPTWIHLPKGMADRDS
jgi:hypothetical protein